MFHRIYLYTTLLFVALLLLGGCAAKKSLTHLNSLDHGEFLATTPEGVIGFLPGDSVIVRVKGATGKMKETLRNLSDSTGGYITALDEHGDIRLPDLGKFQLSETDKKEAEDKIARELAARKLAVNPKVSIRHLHPGVVVCGEVYHPGRVPINDPEFNVLNALHAAGDITPYAKRDAIMVLHTEEGGYRVYALSVDDRVGLVQSPAFLLSDNDIIYVKPSGPAGRDPDKKAKGRVSSSFWISVATLLMSTGVIVSTVPDD